MKLTTEMSFFNAQTALHHTAVVSVGTNTHHAVELAHFLRILPEPHVPQNIWHRDCVRRPANTEIKYQESSWTEVLVSSFVTLVNHFECCLWCPSSLTAEAWAVTTASSCSFRPSPGSPPSCYSRDLSKKQVCVTSLLNPFSGSPLPGGINLRLLRSTVLLLQRLCWSFSETSQTVTNFHCPTMSVAV